MIIKKVLQLIPVLFVLIIIFVLWLAPLERSLGSTIKYVYLHVALTWSATVGMSLMAVLGVGYVFWRHEPLDHWRQAIGRVTLSVWFLAIVISTVAAKIAWGSVSWSEPLIIVALLILVSLLVIQLLEGIIHSPVIRGLVSIFPIGFLIVLTHQVPRIIHPDDPIKSSDYWPIKLTFYILFLVCLLLAVWLVWFLEQRRKANR